MSGPERHRPLIVGTAGHIDHGKTALIRLLTGVDTDRLKEEKERGISIELGFASLTLPSGEAVGVVDVPGHERFIHHMLAGVGGIDLILFVIAADEGVMPQTREHMDIIGLLGVERGVVALTKVDMVDADFADLVEETVREYLAGTSLREAPIVRVSSVTGEGKEAVRRALETVCAAARVRDRGHLRRLPVDRVFTMEGFGTVVTGTLWAGALREGEAVRILPEGITTRIKSLQVHGRRVPEARAGQRVAVLLHAVEKAAIERGDWLLAGEEGAATTFVDARLRLLPGLSKPLANGARVRFHLGAAETLGRVVLLESDQLKPGAEGWAQLRLETPVVAERGDLFVLRTYSPMLTVAGGTVVTAGVGRRRRFRQDDLGALQQADRGTPAERVLAVLVRHGGLGAERGLLARESGGTADEVEGAIAELVAAGRARAVGRKVIVAREAFEEAGTRMRGDLEEYQRRTPLSWGLMKSELKKRVEGGIHADLVEAWVQQEIEAGRLFARGDRLRYGTDQLELGAAHATLRQRLLAAVEAAGFDGRKQREVMEAVAAGAGPASRDAEALLLLLVDSGEIVRVPPDFYFARSRLDDMARRVREFFATSREMKVADLKDLIGVSRKQAVPLLEYLDQSRLTQRQGDVRLAGPKLRG